MARLAIIGAAGFIGSHTAAAALDAGHSVLGLDNFRTGRREHFDLFDGHPGFTGQALDARDRPALAAALRAFGAETVIHLGALVSVAESVERPDLNFDLNLALTAAVAGAAVEAGVRRIVFASSAAIYGDQEALPIREEQFARPLSPYGAAKLASEHVLATWPGLEAVCLRYFNVYGPRQDPTSPYSGVISVFARRARLGQAATIFGDGGQARDFVFVGDVARANVAAALAAALPPGPCNVCTGGLVTVAELHAALRALYPQSPPPVHGPARAGDIRLSQGTPDRLAAWLGWCPSTPLATGLAALRDAAGAA